MYANESQICTWRNLLGGVQYSNIFPTFLGMTLGQGSIPWIWRYCESRVLEGMATALGESQMRRLILEYRAKQALVDMGEWTGAIIARRSKLNGALHGLILIPGLPHLMSKQQITGAAFLSLNTGLPPGGRVQTRYPLLSVAR